MSFTPELQATFLKEIFEEWSMRADEELKKAVRKRERHVPEGTLDALRHDLIEDSKGFIGYALRFGDSGRHVDMKRLNFKKRPISREENFMLEWAKKRGKRYMKFVPGYKTGKASKLTEDEKLERFASAIIASYDRDATSRKRRGAWYNRLIWKLISDLIEMLVKRQPEFLARHIAEDIQRTLTEGV